MSIDPAGAASLLHTPAAMVQGRFDSGTRHCGSVRSDEVIENVTNTKLKMKTCERCSEESGSYKLHRGDNLHRGPNDERLCENHVLKVYREWVGEHLVEVAEE